MISYEPLWETMRKKSATTYTLRNKGGVSGSTLLRLQAGESVSTNTLDAICKVLRCTVSDVVAYVPEEPVNSPECMQATTEKVIG